MQKLHHREHFLTEISVPYKDILCKVIPTYVKITQINRYIAKSLQEKCFMISRSPSSNANNMQSHTKICKNNTDLLLSHFRSNVLVKDNKIYMRKVSMAQATKIYCLKVFKLFNVMLNKNT